MKYPKLHNWQHHIIDAIRNYGAINGFTTETYESLHKFYIKAPYRMSNRRDATSQIINLVRHDSILNYLQKITSPPSIKKHRQIRTLGGIEGSFTLDTFNDFVDEYRTTHFLALEAEKAFEVLIDSLNQYFDLIENITDKDVEATIIKWYTSAFIREVDTIRAKSNYYNAPAFSDIAINMNEEEAEKYNTIDGILMLFGLKIPGHDEQELALVHWYDFKYNDLHRLFKYDCPYVKRIPMFTVIAIESIIEPVHIIPCFNKTNEYFVNYFIF
ncbi:hypothetical protein RhiirC2_799672 [Rhizophagus irregularis]|nr:hypothetical protein RhiirC2_799672 [Rhizophagus irregularis]